MPQLVKLNPAKCGSGLDQPDQGDEFPLGLGQIVEIPGAIICQALPDGFVVFSLENIGAAMSLQPTFLDPDGRVGLAVSEVMVPRRVDRPAGVGSCDDSMAPRIGPIGLVGLAGLLGLTGPIRPLIGLTGSIDPIGQIGPTGPRR